MQIFLLVLTALLLYVSYKYILIPYKRYYKYKKHGLGLFIPFIGMLFFMKQAMEKGDFEYLSKHFFDYVKDQNQNKLFVYNLGSNVYVELVDSQLAKEFLQNQNEYYVKYDGIPADSLKRFVSGGLVFSEGEKWKKLRTCLSGAFHYEQLHSIIPIIEKLTRNRLEDLIKQDKLSKVDLIEVFKDIAGETVVETFFGDCFQGKLFKGKTIPNAIGYIIETLIEQSLSLQGLIFGAGIFQKGIGKKNREFNQYMEDFKQMIKEIVIQRKSETTNQKDGIFNIIYYLKKNNLLNEISDDEIVSQFLSFYNAGMDTSAHMLGMAIYYLTQAPQQKKLVQKEIDELKNIDYQSLQNLPYLNALIKESLRFYGPATKLFYRVAIKDHQLGNIFVQKGDIINVSLAAIHRNPLSYENPHEFNIQRWIENKNVNLFSFFPFSGGPKICIGQHLALIESKIILAKFFKMFDFESEKGYVLKYKMGSVYGPVDNLQINLKVR